MKRLVFYDFEVFVDDWMVVLIDYETKQERVIHNNVAELRRFYEANQDVIWVGYNSKDYDQYILRGILLGLDPYQVNHQIIHQKKRGWEVVNSKKFPICNYDVYDKSKMGNKSLKYLEGMMGSAIIESPIPFDLERSLTREELQQVYQYCRWDVLQTIKLFEVKELKQFFEAKVLLIDLYGLPYYHINKTDVQLAEIILKSQKLEHITVEQPTIIPTLSLHRYREVLNWYQNLNYTEIEKERKRLGKKYESPSYVIQIGRMETRLGLGGIHGAINHYVEDGVFIFSDVSSMYPSLMINYNFLPRSIQNPQSYREVRDKRIAYKEMEHPLHKALKLIINAVSGATRATFSSFYDPTQGNNITINGQLLTLDLIETVQELPGLEMIQCNTDGIIVKLPREEDYSTYLELCEKWCQRTGLDLEHKRYRRMIQKDVSNYLAIPFDKTEKIKGKGSWLRPYTDIKGDIPIVTDAVRNFLVHQIPIEETIHHCQDYRLFQQVVRLSKNHIGFKYQNQQLPQKVVRVYASSLREDGKLQAMTESNTEVNTTGTPTHAYIDNRQVADLAIPPFLDRQYYINLAKDRIKAIFDESSR